MVSSYHRAIPRKILNGLPKTTWFLVFFFLATACCMWDLSSPTRDWTQAPCNGRVFTTGPSLKSPGPRVTTLTDCTSGSDSPGPGQFPCFLHHSEPLKSCGSSSDRFAGIESYFWPNENLFKNQLRWGILHYILLYYIMLYNVINTMFTVNNVTKCTNIGVHFGEFW